MNPCDFPDGRGFTNFSVPTYSSTCRSRKIKCDEESPVCGPCRKSSRHCKPGPGIFFRHQQNASLNNDLDLSDEPAEGDLGGFYSYRNTFNKDCVWVKVPKKVTFVSIVDPYAEVIIPPSEESNAPEGNIIHPLPPSSTWDQPTGPETLSLLIRKPAVLDESIAIATAHLPILRPDVQEPILPESSRDLPENGYHTRATSPTHREIDFEIAFLLRHFSEIPGRWYAPLSHQHGLRIQFAKYILCRMDLFDCGQYFASVVPLKAYTNSLLKFAACAYAAKQLGRVHKVKAGICDVYSYSPQPGLLPDAQSQDWCLIGMKYYNKAISLLKEKLYNNSPQPLGNSARSEYNELSSMNHLHDYNSLFSPDSPSLERDRVISEEVLAATAILSVYEFLDTPETAWEPHLHGAARILFQSLEFVASPSSSYPINGFFPATRIQHPKTRRAIFWNFARQDCLSALISESTVHFDVTDINLWVDAGLQLDSEGFLLPHSNLQNSYEAGETETEHEIENEYSEDVMMSNGLIWLISKLANFIAAADVFYPLNPHSEETPQDFIGVNQRTLLERWLEIQKEFQIWYDRLPVTFKSYARAPYTITEPTPLLPPSHNNNSNNNDQPPTLSSIWYSTPLSAHTMQHHHMSQILLLLNKPHESTSRRSSILRRLQSYRSISAQVRHHGHEICRIALGNPTGSVRVHSLQPLWVAGCCLTEPWERRLVLRLLRALQAELGWRADCRIASLLRQWEWERENDLPVCACACAEASMDHAD
ncbi:MAG: hypothetical protein M1834_008217 [Cirrosporium novae-zelandiae]|nr:MAG: hypothetical protein M1834_008217 [Cirrosporium novae-zelandiae]